MRIQNLTAQRYTLSDIDRGISNRGIYEDWNAKQDSGIPAWDRQQAGSGILDLLDTERVMLSSTYGQIKTLVTAGKIATYYAITGCGSEPFDIRGAADTFMVQVDSDPVQTFVLPHGSLSATDVANTINATCTGFVADASLRFFRAENTDHIIGAKAEGSAGVGYGVRGPSIVSGFVVLYGNLPITIGVGGANDVLGFTKGDRTLAK